MGLFDRHIQPQSDVQPLYTISSSMTKLIIGLGNPGKEYISTRHNIGFMCLEDFAARHSASWIEKKDFKCHYSELRLGGTRVILVKPMTFMNLSGQAVQAVQSFYKIASGAMVVVHDELDIPFGQIRTRVGGSSAGHNGLKSLITVCGKDFARIRIGINGQHAQEYDAAEYVLKNFTKNEKSDLAALYTEVTSILTEFVYGGQLQHETRSFLIP